jgi:hypothetical protein
VLIVTASCIVGAAAQSVSTTPPSTAPPRVATPLLAEQLEQAGLSTEAASEAVRALPTASPEDRERYIALLNRIRDRNAASDLQRRNGEFSKRMALGDELLRRGLQEDARREYVSAAENAATDQQRDRALSAADRTRRVSMIDGGSGDRVRSALRGILENGVAAIVVTAILGTLWLLAGRPSIAAVKSVRQRFSKRAVIADFEDDTTTGLGKGLPALIRTLHREQQEFQATSPGGSVLVPYPVPGGLPLLSAPAAETDFTWAGLSVGGAPLKAVLARWSAAWHAPWSTTTGTIYQAGQDVRLSVTIATHRQQSVGWDASLQDGVNPPRDAAYRVLFTIVDQWERRDE